MPLHRDIFWVGRQWAVTGYGLQAVNQKRHAGFDIEASRIWDDASLESLRAEAWFHPEDFAKALSVARARYPEPPCQAAPTKDVVSPVEKSAVAEPPKAELKPEPLRQAVRTFDLHVERWPAKFTSLWRARIRR
ncbi:hypothetical protein [Bradyrhizobium canariense]|uniref:Uncharacterized protein n=1 Tax=Bradyrhizobium canariense TaxID=255045 RepID=A0A1H1PX83_9BRAD|nr:hypothetical protein [Bradyrhizobium canariense]SDS15812.1 hypothetical protein SAMN05444158_1188 [Bradyrhizobium canariense]